MSAPARREGYAPPAENACAQTTRSFGSWLSIDDFVASVSSLDPIVSSVDPIDEPIQPQKKGKRRVLSVVAAAIAHLVTPPDLGSTLGGLHGYDMPLSLLPFVPGVPMDAGSGPCKCKTTRMCFAQNMTPQELECLVELVRTVGSILDAEHIAWSPVAGSLLGVYRHGSLVIPWDDDYDIAVLRSDEERALQALRKQLPDCQCRLTHLGKMGPKSWGTMYKASFDVGHPRFSGVLREHARAPEAACAPPPRSIPSTQSKPCHSAAAGP